MIRIPIFVCIAGRRRGPGRSFGGAVGSRTSVAITLAAGLSADAVDFEAVVEGTGSLTHFIFSNGTAT